MAMIMIGRIRLLEAMVKGPICMPLLMKTMESEIASR